MPERCLALFGAVAIWTGFVQQIESFHLRLAGCHHTPLLPGHRRTRSSGLAAAGCHAVLMSTAAAAAGCRCPLLLLSPSARRPGCPPPAQRGSRQSLLGQSALQRAGRQAAQAGSAGRRPAGSAEKRKRCDASSNEWRPQHGTAPRPLGGRAACRWWAPTLCGTCRSHLPASTDQPHQPPPTCVDGSLPLLDGPYQPLGRVVQLVIGLHRLICSEREWVWVV
jgi:hypothetical protein